MYANQQNKIFREVSSVKKLSEVLDVSQAKVNRAMPDNRALQCALLRETYSSIP